MQIPWPKQEILTCIYEREVDFQTQDRVVGKRKIKLFIPVKYSETT